MLFPRIPQSLLVVSGRGGDGDVLQAGHRLSHYFQAISIQAMNEFSADVADFEIEEFITAPNLEDFRLLTG